MAKIGAEGVLGVGLGVLGIGFGAALQYPEPSGITDEVSRSTRGLQWRLDWF
jgi:hypothetical protein